MKRTLLCALLLLAVSAAGVSARQVNTRYALRTAFDLTATSYTYYDAAGASGTTSADGWVSMVAINASIIQADITWVTKAATSLDYSVECRNSEAHINVIRQGSLTAVGTDTVIISPSTFSACRIGLKLTTDTGTNSVSASLSGAKESQ